MANHECPCGSGLYSEWERDYQGIPLCRCCDKCRKEKLSHFRPEILTGYSQEDVDEPIEPDYDDWQEDHGFDQFGCPPDNYDGDF